MYGGRNVRRAAGATALVVLARDDSPVIRLMIRGYRDAAVVAGMRPG